jgi:hypothetical protein
MASRIMTQSPLVTSANVIPIWRQSQ